MNSKLQTALHICACSCLPEWLNDRDNTAAINQWKAAPICQQAPAASRVMKNSLRDVTPEQYFLSEYETKAWSGGGMWGSVGVLFLKQW